MYFLKRFIIIYGNRYFSYSLSSLVSSKTWSWLTILNFNLHNLLFLKELWKLVILFFHNKRIIENILYNLMIYLNDILYNPINSDNYITSNMKVIKDLFWKSMLFFKMIRVIIIHLMNSSILHILNILLELLQYLLLKRINLFNFKFGSIFLFKLHNFIICI